MLGLNSRFLLIFLLLGLTHCRWSDPPPSDTIVFALSSEPKTLDPRYATDAGGQRINRLIFSSLLRTGADLKTVGDLAKDWKISDKTFYFTLKPGIRFHHGRYAEAEDFKFSIEEYKKARSPFAPQFSVIRDVKVEYDHKTGGKLTLFLDSFSAPLVSDLQSLSLLPKDIVQAQGENFYAHPVGTGPYQFVKKDIKNVFLTRNDNYFGTNGVTKNLQFKVIKDSTTRFQKMYKGKVDIIQSDVPFSKVQFFEKQKDFNVVVAPGLSTKYILLNLRHPQLKKFEVRKAISSVIDREALIRYSQEGFADPATSIVTEMNPFHHKGLSYDHYSKSKIQEVFKQLGDKPLILKTSNTQEAVETGKVIVHKLRSMGFPVEQQTYEWGTYYEDVRSGRFDMAVMKWVGISDPDIYRISLHSKMVPPGRNRGYYNNPEFDRLVDAAFKEPDIEKRKALYERAQEIVFHDLPTIPLWYEKQVAIVHRRVKGYELPINGDFSALTKVYKEDDGKKR